MISNNKKDKLGERGVGNLKRKKKLVLRNKIKN